MSKKVKIRFNDENDDRLYESVVGKKVYFNESQMRYIKENVNKDKYIENDFNEKWVRMDTNSDIYKTIKSKVNFDNKSKLELKDVAQVEKSNPHYIAIIYGGLNGGGKWIQYLSDIAKIIKNIPNSYIIDLDVDTLDDVWTLKIGFKKENLNEGAWGVKPEESDTYLDFTHELGEPIIKILHDKLPKYVDNPEHNDGNIYCLLGLLLDMLKVKAFDESWLYSNKKNEKYLMIRELFKTANNGFKYLLTDTEDENRMGWRNYNEYKTHLTKMYDEFKGLTKYYNMSKDDDKKSINESQNIVEPNKVLLVKKYLDDNFVRASMPIIGADGYPKTMYIVGMKGTDGNVIKNMTAKQLFYLLQDKFKGIYGDKSKRNKFIKQVMIDWYNKKISNEGLLSKNMY